MFNDLGLLFVRVVFGGLVFLNHGWGKLYPFSERAMTFPDPLGIGSKFSLGIMVFSEVFCALLLVVGLASRIVCVPLALTMCMSFFVLHVLSPFSVRESYILYGVVFLCLFFTGPGVFSVDGLLQAKRKIKGAVFRP